MKQAKKCYIYIGPTIRGLIQEGTAYVGVTRDEAIAPARSAIEKRPTINNMIVPAEIATQERIKARTPDTALYKCRERILSGK